MGTNRTRLSAALLTLATFASGLVVALGAAPAQAAWTDADGLTRYRVCKEPSGQAWTFLVRVRKRAGTEDARAGIALYARGHRRQAWRSGWLRDGEVSRGWVRVRRQPGVRLQVWQEAGDRDSMIGTSMERRTLQPRRVRRCSAGR